jgi:ABC-2 type transport system ATP-binding protein
MNSGIIVEGLTKIYSHRKRQGRFRSVVEQKIAVNQLNLSLMPGQVIGLLGLNGAGKTTTIKMLSTLLLPTAGGGQVDDLDLIDDAKAVRRRINMIVGGERMVYWRLTGRENLWYFAQLYDIEQRGLQERINTLLELVGLHEAADIPVERYSKGMKQRLQIARGLINDPAYLFLDEPTLGLDAPIAREVRGMVRRLANEGKGILLTSHYLTEVEELCSHIYVIEQGRVIASGSPSQLKALTQTDRVIRVLMPHMPTAVQHALQALVQQYGARLEEEHNDKGMVVTLRHPEDITGDVAAAVALHGGSILKFEVVEPTLEDAIVALAMGSRSREVDVYETI